MNQWKIDNFKALFFENKDEAKNKIGWFAFLRRQP